MKPALGQPLLPYDVLLRVASFCSQSTLASLTAANRDLYEACVLMLLDDPVELKDSKSALSFVDFLNADCDTRWPRLHALIFGDMKLDKEAAVRLVDHLPLASSLKSLEFRHAERTLSSDSRLGTVLTGLQTVTEVDIRHVGPRGAKMLSAMKWDLESATLAELLVSGTYPSAGNGDESAGKPDKPAEDEDEEDEEDEVRRYDAPWLLFRADQSLKDLQLHNWRNRDVHYGICPMFQELTSFTFTTSEVFFPRTIPWMWSFSSLWDLEVSIGRNRAVPLTAADVEDVEHARRENLDDQSSQTHELWPHGLRSFRGSVLDFYALGIHCGIYQLTLELYAEDMRLVPAVLETARPSILLLLLQDDVQMTEISKIFAFPGADDIGGVVLIKDGVEVGDDPQVVVYDIVDALLGATAHLRLKAFRVSLGLVDTSTDAAGGNCDNRIDSYVNALDAEKLSTRIFESAPATLETAMLQLSWHDGSTACEKSIKVSRGGEIVVN